jgi:hypothetical protein
MGIKNAEFDAEVDSAEKIAWTKTRNNSSVNRDMRYKVYTAETKDVCPKLSNIIWRKRMQIYRVLAAQQGTGAQYFRPFEKMRHES